MKLMNILMALENKLAQYAKPNKIVFQVLFVNMLCSGSSCRIGMDFNPKLINIKNRSQRNIVTYVSPDSLYYDKTLFHLGGSPMLSPNRSCQFNSAVPDTFYLYFFDNDSIVANIKNNKLKGIVQRSFLGKRKLYRVNTNENDTIIFNSPSSIDYIRKTRR